MTFATYYDVGTVSVTAGSVAVTGSATGWIGNVQPGDYLWVGGIMCRIASVVTATAMTLARPWPGATATGVAYEAMAVLDAVGYQRSVRNLIDALEDGNIPALAALPNSADTLPYLMGGGAAGLVDFKAVARSFIAANYMPVQQGGGPGQLDNKLRIGWTGARLNAQVDSYDQGSIWTDAVAPVALVGNGYLRLPHGLMLQWGSVAPSIGSQTITFPLAFAAIFGVLVTPEGGASGDTMVSQWVSSKSTASFVLSTRRAVNGGLVDSIAFPTKWLAIGSV